MFRQIFLCLFALFTAFGIVAQEAPKKPSPANDYVFPMFPEENSPEAQSTDKFFSEFFNMLMILGLIIFLILFAAWFLKRMVNTKMLQANETSQIKIIERRGLTPKTAVYLLEINGKSIAIAESHTGVTHLGEVPTASSPEISEPKKESSAFGKIYEDKLKGNNK